LIEAAWLQFLHDEVCDAKILFRHTEKLQPMRPIKKKNGGGPVLGI
jgi:hypothetical protein